MHCDSISFRVFNLAGDQQQEDGSSQSLGDGFAPSCVGSMYRGSQQMESNMRVIAFNVRHMDGVVRAPMRNAFLTFRMFVQMFYFLIFLSIQMEELEKLKV